jgi:starch phosphorylase
VQFTGSVRLERAGSFGYNVRVVPRHPLLANPAELGLITVAR